MNSSFKISNIVFLEMHKVIGVLIFMVATCLLLGCDATSLRSTGHIAVLQSLENFQVRVGEERRIILADYFQHEDGSPLRFEAKGDNIPVRISGSGDVLVIGANIPNVSREVSIMATAQTGATLDTTFNVFMNCPTAPATDEVSYFPNQIGQQWVFDYTSSNSIGSGLNASGAVEGSGTLTWVIVERVDTCTSISLTIEETLDEIRISSSYFNNYIPDTTEVKITSTRIATLWGDSLTIEGYIEADGLLPLPDWIQPLSLAPDTVSADSIQLRGFGGSARTNRYAFARESGLANWYYRSSVRGTWTEEGLSVRP